MSTHDTGDPEEQGSEREREREQFMQSVGGETRYSTAPSREPSHQGPVAARIDTQLGVVGLNASAIRVVAQRLRDNMSKDPVLKQRFYQNPREVLGSVGLNEEIQAELLQNEIDFGSSPFFGQGRLAAWCITTQCCCTSCCLTCWFSF